MTGLEHRRFVPLRLEEMMTDSTPPQESRPRPADRAGLPDPSTQAPTGTLVLMLVFLAAMAGLWILVYRLLLER